MEDNNWWASLTDAEMDMLYADKQEEQRTMLCYDELTELQKLELQEYTNNRNNVRNK